MYASLDQLKNELDQLQDTTEHDTALLEKLERATAFVNAYLGTTSDLTLGTSETRTLYGDGGVFLSSDVPMSTVTAITTLSGYTVPSYVLVDGVLRITDSSGVLVEPRYPSLSGYDSWVYSYGWQRNIPYSVTATFGYSLDDLAVLTEATLQTAVQLWRYRDTGGSETIGSEGAITTVRAGWTPLVKQALESIKRRMRGSSVGIW